VELDILLSAKVNKEVDKMKKSIKFFSRPSTPVNTKSHSAVQTTSEYTEDATSVAEPSVSQNSTDMAGIAELAAKVDALTAIVEKMVVNRGSDATLPNTDAELAAVAQNSEGGEPKDEPEAAPDASAADDGTADTGADVKPEGIPEEDLGTEVPANDGTYTEVPEDDIIKQFSKSCKSEPAELSNLGLMGKETFGCLF